MEDQEKPKNPFGDKEFEKQIQEHVRKHGGTAAVGGADFVQQIMKSAMQAMLDAEMEEHLGYGKNAPEGKNSGNSRNGRGKKTVRGDFGEVTVEPPRDRNGTFEPQLVKKGQKEINEDGFAEKIISLYARGMTTREIEAHLRELYELDISRTFVSRVVDNISEAATEWQNRPLEKLYTVMYMDGIRFKVRDDGSVKNKVVYICLGVTVEGLQEVLGLWTAENEGAAFWVSVLNDIKARGVEDILIACVDGLTGFPDAIESVYPQTDVQLCIVHQIRNSTKFVPWKDRKAFCKSLKAIYGADTLPLAEQALEKLDEEWGQKYPASVKSWRTHWERLTAFFKYPVELRKIIYTTNSIESLNSMLRKNTKNRKVFPSDQSLMKLLYLNIKNATKKWRHRQNWDIVVNQLALIFDGRIVFDAY